MFQHLAHILFVTTDYTVANKTAELLLWSTTDTSV